MPVQQTETLTGGRWAGATDVRDSGSPFKEKGSKAPRSLTRIKTFVIGHG